MLSAAMSKYKGRKCSHNFDLLVTSISFDRSYLISSFRNGAPPGQEDFQQGYFRQREIVDLFDYSNRLHE